MEIALAGVVVGHGAVVGVGDHVDGALLHHSGLDEGEGGHIAGDLIGVGSAQHQHLAAGLLALEHIDPGVAVCILQAGKPVGKQLDVGHARSLLRPGDVTGGHEVHAGVDHNGHRKGPARGPR